MESAENLPQPNSDRSQANSNPPRSKTETIALLNASIDKLEETIRRISEDSVQIPPNDSMDNLLSTAQELEDAVAAIEAKIVAPKSEPEITELKTPEATEPIVPPTSVTTVKPTPPPTEKIPPAKPRKNIALIISAVTAIAIAIVTLLWLQPEFIADLLPKESVPEVAVSLDEATEKLVEQPSANLLEDEGIDIDSDADLGIVRDISAMDFPEEIESVAEPIEDVVETVIPSELASPSKPEDLKMVAIEPELNFTPEQNLVATLETKISELTQVQESEFIQNIQINPDRSLLVRVTDDWYELDEAEQNDLGNEILQRSRRFSFERLELKDDRDTLVARSPIIGEKIILQGVAE